MSCPRCQTENREGRRFCARCGAALPLPCAACGFPNDPGDDFCGGCGASLRAAPAGPAAALRSPQAYTPRHLVEKILASGTALAGERKHVTVLFADLKGSMELLADRDPEDARQILEPVLGRMMDAVHRYEGTVNQVMGDGIMALFGAPLAHEDHAVRACYAALRMQDEMRRYTEELRRRQGVEVQIRVGLHSGDVVVGSIGSDLRMEYTAVGQTTHLAARMEQLAPPGTTRLTADTLRLAESFVQVRPLGPIPVKGVAEPVEVFELVGAGAVRTRLQAARARGFTRFVGRDAELEQIREAAEQARHGCGQLVAVVGEAGVGKSRLFWEFIHSHRPHGWLVLEASSASYRKASPFLPLADLLREYFRIEDRDDPRTVRAKVTGTVLTLDRTLEDVLPAMLWILDALGDDDAFLALEPAQRRRHAIEGVTRVLLGESRIQPVLLLFEDLHWVDRETQSALDALVERLPAAPLLLAVNYRPEYRHGWGGKTYYRQLRIDPLRPEGADELLRTLLGDDPSVRPLVPFLVARTEGNPLFLEESVRTLVETRALVGDAGAYRLAGSPETIQVPPTVQAILAARIDRLRPELKQLLQAAAVVGKDVPAALLEAVVDMPEDDLRRALTELQTAEFLYEARLFPDLEYTFKHALTHEVAYGSMLQERRRALHGAIVDAIERLHADRLAEQVEMLAHHAVRGGITAKALRYLREAGTKAAQRSANRDAIAFFESALALLAECPETPATLSEALDVRLALGVSLIAIHGAPAPLVEQSYLKALDLVERLDDPARRFLVLWGLWYVRFTRADYAPAREAGERLLEIAQSGDDRGRLVEAHHTLWPTLVSMGELRAALPHMERGMALYEPDQHARYRASYGGHDPGACCRYYRALCQWLLGYPDQALATVQDAARLAETLADPMTTTLTLWFVTLIHYVRGERAAALHTGERMLAMAEAHGFSAWVNGTSVFLYASREGQLSVDALNALHRLQDGSPSTAWRRVLSCGILAELLGAAGRPEEGLRVLAALDEFPRHGYYAPELFRVQGELLMQGASGAEAERSFHAAIDLARERDAKSLELRAVTSLARLWSRQGKRADARRALADVHGWFTEGHDTADLRRARRLLEELGG
jgi:class 3 adenylate cyclase/tetratricopeptide (TPR) repeat protein